MKTREELNALKEEVKALKEKLSALTEEELEQVTGGNWWPDYYGEDGYLFKETRSKSSAEGTVIDR